MRVQPWHQEPWDWRAAIQFVCGGTGTGLLLWTTVAAFQDTVWLTRTGWLALVIICIGLFSVWVKLGRHWRALFVVRNLFTSWMSREAWLALPLLVLGVAGVLLSSLGLVTAAALFGLTFLYAQARILQASKGIPAWREMRLLPLMVTTGLVEGAALLLMVTGIFDEIGLWLTLLLVGLLILRLWAWAVYRQALLLPGAAPLKTVVVLEELQRPFTLIGNLLPLVVVLLAVVVGGGTAVFHIVAGLLALGGGWYLKFTLVTRAAYNQGFALPHTPARTPGYGGPGTKPGWH